MESLSHPRPNGPLAIMLFALGAVSTLTIWLPAEWPLLVIQAAFFGLAVLAGSPAATVWIVAALPLWGLTQIMFQTTSVISASVRTTLFWLTVSAIFWAASSLLSNVGTRARFHRVSAAFAVAICALSLLQFFTSEGKHFWAWQGGEPQVLGPFQSRNNFATYALLMAPIVLWKGIEDEQPAWGWLAGAALIVGGVAASGSRAGAALMLIELVAFAILSRRRLGRKVLLIGVSLIVLSIGVAGWTHLAGKLSDSDPWRFRREMVISAIAMTRDQPLLGYGFGTYPSVYPAYAQFDSGHRINHAHNDWAEWASEGGFLFLGLLILFAASLMPAAIRHPWALGLPFVCAHALVDYPFQRIGVVFWFVVIAAAVRQESATFGTVRNSGNDG
jgi:O-antigen ligase